jgi:hypothetical protein
MQSHEGGEIQHRAPGVGPGAVEVQAIQEGVKAMSAEIVVINRNLFNVDNIVNVKWKEATLYVDFVGDRFHAFNGRAAEIVWSYLKSRAIDLETGELGSNVGK